MTLPRPKSVLIWGALIAIITVPLIAAGLSPLLAWREPVYIIAGFAGIAALALLVVQPLLALGVLPELSLAKARKLHRIIGAGLVLCVVVHVGGLWMTSPPDVIDALTFTSPTPFSAWGVIAMWAVFIAAFFAFLRRHLKLRVMTWRRVHIGLAAITVVGTVIHTLLIDGTMEWLSKLMLCGVALLMIAKVLQSTKLRASRKTDRKPRPDVAQTRIT